MWQTARKQQAGYPQDRKVKIKKSLYFIVIKKGKTLRMGQRVQFIYTIGEPGVFAWDLPETPDPRTIHISRYKELLLRASCEVLQPLGVSKDALKNCLLNNTNSPSLESFPLFSLLPMCRF